MRFMARWPSLPLHQTTLILLRGAALEVSPRRTPVLFGIAALVVNMGFEGPDTQIFLFAWEHLILNNSRTKGPAPFLACQRYHSANEPPC
jgi:hypothetical protein